MFRKLITLFVLFYISLLFTGCTNEDIANAVNGGSGKLAPLSTLSGSFVFEMDEREHDGDFQKMYVNLDNGSLHRVESRVEEAGECMVHEEFQPESMTSGLTFWIDRNVELS